MFGRDGCSCDVWKITISGTREIECTALREMWKILDRHLAVPMQ